MTRLLSVGPGNYFFTNPLIFNGRRVSRRLDYVWEMAFRLRNVSGVHPKGRMAAFLKITQMARPAKHAEDIIYTYLQFLTTVGAKDESLRIVKIPGAETLSR